MLAVVAGSYLILRRITQSPFGMVLQSIRENEARTRAIGYPVERYKIVAVMLSGLFAGLAGVLYAVQNQFAAPDFVFFVVSGETVIFNVMGGIGTLVGPIVGAGFFLLLRESAVALLRRPVPYLIPLGMIFIAMVIFLPQGLLGIRPAVAQSLTWGVSADRATLHGRPILREDEIGLIVSYWRSLRHEPLTECCRRSA